MLPESVYTEEVKRDLPKLNLSLEMAVAAEWVVRDEDHPDRLELVFLSPTDNEQELQAGCSCVLGALNQPCPHALAVFEEIRDLHQILKEIMSAQREPQRVA